MNPTILALREAVITEEKNLANKGGVLVAFNEHGPVSMRIIKALVIAIESQAQEIDQLKHQIK